MRNPNREGFFFFFFVGAPLAKIMNARASGAMWEWYESTARNLQ